MTASGGRLATMVGVLALTTAASGTWSSGVVASTSESAPSPSIDAAEPSQAAPVRRPDVIFLATPDPVVDGMLKLAKVGKGDVVYDLGCGDGRIVIAAAKRYGARGVGIDIDPARIQEANANARTAGVADRVTFILGDIFDPHVPIADASVVTLFLLPSLNQKLMPRLKSELKRGSRIVSNSFDMGEAWPAEARRPIGTAYIYLWTIR